MKQFIAQRVVLMWHASTVTKSWHIPIVMTRKQRRRCHVILKAAKSISLHNQLFDIEFEKCQRSLQLKMHYGTPSLKRLSMNKYSSFSFPETFLSIKRTMNIFGS